MKRVVGASCCIVMLFCTARADDKPAKPDEPLVFDKLVARLVEMKAEEAAAKQAGNTNVYNEILDKHAEEQKSWVGKQIEGTAQVYSVEGSVVQLSNAVLSPSGRRYTSSRLTYITATMADKGDPLLTTLKRGSVVEFTGKLTERPVSASRLTVKECTFTARADDKTAKSDKPAKPDEPLLLDKLVAKLVEQKAEERAANQAGNTNVYNEILDKHAEEQKSWVGKQIEGTAKVIGVNQNEVRLGFEYAVPSSSRRQLPSPYVLTVFARTADRKDPLLATLKRGNLVEFKGELVEPRPTTRSMASLTVKGCTLKLAK
jgi:membrane-bound inhibitor of C-type lysozyme